MAHVNLQENVKECLGDVEPPGISSNMERDSNGQDHVLASTLSLLF